jgi:hypothetical protein
MEAGALAGDPNGMGDGNGAPSFTPPMPTPVNTGIPTSQAWPNPARAGMVQPAGYPAMMYPRPYGGFAPMQMPMGPMPMNGMPMGAMPMGGMPDIGLPMNSQPPNFGAGNAFSGN